MITPTQSTYPWRRLAIGGAGVLLVGMGLGRFSYTPLIPAIVTDGALSAAEAGYVGAFNLAGFVFGALVEPKLRRRWGERRSLQIALIAALACLIASTAPWGFTWLAFWRGLVGVCVGVMMIQALTVVTRATPPNHLGAATGMVFTGVGVGIVLSGILIPKLLAYGLFGAWVGIAGIGAVGVCIAFWGLAGNIPEITAASEDPAQSTSTIPPADAARLIASQGLFTVGLIAHTIYWIDYLVRGLGHDMAFGGAHWALFGLGALTGTYLWGRLADKIGFQAGLVLVFASLAASVALPVLNSSTWALIASSLIVGAQPGCSALLSGRAHQIVGGAEMPKLWRRMTLSSGICQAIGSYALVALFNWDGDYQPIFLVSAATMALGALATAGLRPVQSAG